MKRILFLAVLVAGATTLSSCRAASKLATGVGGVVGRTVRGVTSAVR